MTASWCVAPRMSLPLTERILSPSLRLVLAAAPSGTIWHRENTGQCKWQGGNSEGQQFKLAHNPNPDISQTCSQPQSRHLPKPAHKPQSRYFQSDFHCQLNNQKRKKKRSVLHPSLNFKVLNSKRSKVTLLPVSDYRQPAPVYHASAYTLYTVDSTCRCGCHMPTILCTFEIRHNSNVREYSSLF